MTLAQLDAWIVQQEAKKSEQIAPDPFKHPKPAAPGRAVLHSRHRKDTP